MTKRCAQYFSIVVLTLLFVSSEVSLARLNISAQQDAKTNRFASDPMLEGLASYKKWTRVNDQPKQSNNFQLDDGG